MSKVVLIYANWCGHCDMLKPKWQSMKPLLSDKLSVVEIEDSDPFKHDKINELNSEINNENINVMGYPTLFKINRGEIEYYNDEREPETMAKFFNKDVESPKLKVIKSKKNKTMKKSVSKGKGKRGKSGKKPSKSAKKSKKGKTSKK